MCSFFYHFSAYFVVFVMLSFHAFRLHRQSTSASIAIVNRCECFIFRWKREIISSHYMLRVDFDSLRYSSFIFVDDIDVVIESNEWHRLCCRHKVDSTDTFHSVFVASESTNREANKSDRRNIKIDFNETKSIRVSNSRARKMCKLVKWWEKEQK